MKKLPLLLYVIDYSSKTLVKSTGYSDSDLEGELVSLRRDLPPEDDYGGAVRRNTQKTRRSALPPVRYGVCFILPWNVSRLRILWFIWFL